MGTARVNRRRAARSGGGGIRTRGPRRRTPVFKTGAFDRSATPPRASVGDRHTRGAAPESMAAPVMAPPLHDILGERDARPATALALLALVALLIVDIAGGDHVVLS